LCKIETKNFIIIPLDFDNLKLYIENKTLLEEKLKLTVTNDKLSGKSKKMFMDLLRFVMHDEKNYLWHTNWIIILKSENIIIGGVLFKGPPDNHGEVEIGYRLDSPFRKKGYMTMILSEMIKYTFKNSDVTSIIAETKKDNIASQKVLKKVGMHRYKENKKYYWYRSYKH
jgi:RimJ/RimL family protein N-acetyltransferase